MTRSWRPSGIRARRLLLALAAVAVTQLALLGDVGGGGPRHSPAASPFRAPAAGARALVPVSSESPGRVVAVGAPEGQYVRAGTVLLGLDVAPYRRALAGAYQRLTRARADADRAAAVLSQRERAANADTSLAARELEQTAGLGPHAPGAGAGDLRAEQALAQARRDMAVAARAVLRVAEARVEDARAQADRDTALLAQGAIPANRVTEDRQAYQAAEAQASAAADTVRQAEVPHGQPADRPGPADFDRAQAALAAAQRDEVAARASLEAAGRTVDRDTGLLGEGAIPAQQLAKDKAAYQGAQAASDAAAATARQAEARLESLRAARQNAAAAQQAATAAAQRTARAQSLARGAEAEIGAARAQARDLAAAQARVVAAEAAVRAARSRLAGTQVRAPASGWVTAGAVKPGDVVQPGRPFLWIATDPGAPGVAHRPGTPTETAAGAAGSREPGSAPSALRAIRDRAGAGRERLGRIAEQERQILARLDAESAEIRAIVLRSGSISPTGAAPALLRDGLPWPVIGRVTSPYGWRVHPLFHTPEFHTGIDIAAALGTPVRAPADGTVLFAGRMPANGMLVVIDHGNGMSTTYSHLLSSAVRAGEHVRRGQIIATVGSSGWSTGPHLFFEVRENGQPIDPIAP
jgi:murein DD-endopeptidase MepM/ murein hydrolase activator NlpD